MLKLPNLKTLASAKFAKAGNPETPSSTGTVTPADTAPISSNSDPLISVLNSLQSLIQLDPETPDSLVSGMRAKRSALSLIDERRLLGSIFPSLDGRIWEVNMTRAEGRGESLTAQFEEAIQFYFDNYIGYS